jgi:hypothetical protein
VGVQQAGGRLIENLALRVLGQQPFDFPPKLGIGTRKASGSTFTRPLVQLLDLLKTLGSHTRYPYELSSIVPHYCSVTAADSEFLAECSEAAFEVRSARPA